MSDIKWTKKYDLKVDSRHFPILVSEHEKTGCHAICVWYERGRMLKASGQFGHIVFLLEQRDATTEAKAIKELIDWANEKFGTQYLLHESAA